MIKLQNLLANKFRKVIEKAGHCAGFFLSKKCVCLGGFIVIYLFTDFGFEGPYVGMMKSAISALNPDVCIVDLMHDVPAYKPLCGSVLLSRLSSYLPDDCYVVAVVDPGVGSNQRLPVIIQTTTITYIGPDNKLFDLIPDVVAKFKITWQPKELSSTFHGRDIFAPVAGLLAMGQAIENLAVEIPRSEMSERPLMVVYIDGFGNVMTSFRLEDIGPRDQVCVQGRTICRAETFSSVKPGTLFWYINSIGLVEFSINQGSAAKVLGYKPGDKLDGI